MPIRKPVLLVVDDEKHVRDFLDQSLSKSYRVLTAQNGQQAKVLYQRFGGVIDAVITDAEMPITDGVALPSWLLGQSKPPPLILMGGSETHTTLAARELWHDASGVSWLDKPFAPEQLRRLLGDRIGRFAGR